MPFDQIIGQGPALRFLRRSLEQGRLGHALLFSGPTGVGKRTTALALAQAVNCPQPQAGDACGACPACRRIAAGNHPDVHWISPEGQWLKIDQVRTELQQPAYLQPLEGRTKVFVLEPAEALNPASANSLLKILEEPPDRVLIILISIQPFMLLPTIRSRCQEVRFGLIAADTLARWLEQRHGMTPVEAMTLARLADGRPAEAERQRQPAWQELRNGVLDWVHGVQTSGWFAAARKLEGLNDDLPETLRLMLSWYRDRWVAALGGSPDLLINADHAPELGSAAEAAAEARRLRAVLSAADGLRRNLNPTLLLDVLAGALIGPDPAAR